MTKLIFIVIILIIFAILGVVIDGLIQDNARLQIDNYMLHQRLDYDVVIDRSLDDIRDLPRKSKRDGLKGK